MGEGEILGIACRLLGSLDLQAEKRRDETLRVFVGFARRVLESLGGGCVEGEEYSGLSRVVGNLVKSSASLKGRGLAGMEVPGAREGCPDIYCKVDSIFKQLYLSVEDPKDRLSVMEAYGFLRTVFEYAFLLYLFNNEMGFAVSTLEITGKIDFLSSSRIPFDYGKASTLMSEAVMYTAYRASFDPFFSYLGRWSSRRPLSIVNPYFEESVVEGAFLGGLNPAVLNVLLPSGKESEIVERLERYLREYWEGIADSDYVRDALKGVRGAEQEGEIRLNKAYGDDEEIISLLKEDLPFSYNISVYTISDEGLKRLLSDEMVQSGGSENKYLDKLLNEVVKLMKEEKYKVKKESIRGGPLSLLYTKAAIYHSYMAKTKVHVLPEKYFDVLEASTRDLGGYKGRIVCTNCYLRPYLVWNLKDKPVMVSSSKSFLRVRAYERLCPVHLLIRLTENKFTEKRWGS